MLRDSARFFNNKKFDAVCMANRAGICRHDQNEAGLNRHFKIAQRLIQGCFFVG